MQLDFNDGAFIEQPDGPAKCSQIDPGPRPAGGSSAGEGPQRQGGNAKRPRTASMAVV